MIAVTTPVASAAAASRIVTVPIHRLSIELASRAARVAMLYCRRQGFQVGVTVVDRGGQPQVVLRDTLAMDLTLSISHKKAYTAMTFGRSTSTLIDSAVAAALPQEPTLLFAGGGVPIRAVGPIVGGIGVSGASTAEMDERCAREGVAAINEVLEMQDP